MLAHNDAERVARAVARFIAHRLSTEHPRWYHLHQTDGGRQLNCDLTGEQLVLDDRWRLDPARSDSQVSPPYVSVLDALACQVQEDLAVTCRQGNRNWLAALHVCMPSHWAPAAKIGRSFAKVHAPVPGMASIARRQQYIEQMTAAQTGLVRFVWGRQADSYLNRHPTQGKTGGFDHFESRTFVRTERQTIWGLPEVGASLFTIRPYLVSIDSIRRNPVLAAALVAAIEDMSPAELAYKGLASWRAASLDTPAGRRDATPAGDRALSFPVAP